MSHPEVHVTVPEDAWRPVYEPDEDDAPHIDTRAKLHATLVVNGLSMHLDAWQIVEGSSPQRAVVWDDDLDAIHDAVHADGPFETLTIGGREYAVVATPFS